VSQHRRALGAAGEDTAAAWYEAAGYRVLDRNWRCREGELDLVVERPGVVVFCEVKTRRGTGFGEGFEAVTRDKQLRIRRLATRWLAEHRGARRALRFDVVSVRAIPGQPAAVDVFEAAF
jgi:putative endonuclease